MWTSKHKLCWQTCLCNCVYTVMLINVRCVYLEDEGLPQPDPGKITGQKGKKKKKPWTTQGLLWKISFLGVNSKRSGLGTPLPLCCSGQNLGEFLSDITESGQIQVLRSSQCGTGRLGRPHMCRGPQRGMTWSKTKVKGGGPSSTGPYSKFMLNCGKKQGL